MERSKSLNKVQRAQIVTSDCEELTEGQLFI